MKYFQSIRTQLLLAITLTLFIFLLISMGGAYFFQKTALTKESITKITEIDKVLRAGLKGQMFAHNTELTQTLVDEINTFKNVADIFIINNEGIVKFSQDHSQLGKKFFKEQGECRQCHHDAAAPKNLTLKIKNSHGVSVLRNVTHIYNETACFSCHPADQRILGLMFIDYSTTDTDALISATLLRVFLTAVAAFIILSLVVFYIANLLIYNPITLLIDGTREIIKGNYKKQINYQGNREFAALANSFNDMSKGIVRHINAIKNNNFELSVLYAIVKRISETIYLEELKIIIIELLLDVLDCDRCIVITPTKETKSFEMIAKDKEAPPVKSILEYPVPEPAELIVTEKRILDPFKRWVSKELTMPELSGDVVSANIPLAIHDLQLGLIIAVRNANAPFDDEGFRLLSVVREHLAVAFENARLYTMAITDELTGLFTIRHFKAQMEIQRSRFIRYGQKYSLLMMDIDKFKMVNDTHGHPADNALLKEVAAAIRECLRDVDIPCRYGGEEFAVLLPETNEAGALSVAERIRENIERKATDPGNGAQIKVTISIGAASCPGSGSEVRDILLAADEALYKAKETGRNKVILG